MVFSVRFQGPIFVSSRWAISDAWGVAYSSFMLARQAGIDIEYQYADQPLRAARAYLKEFGISYFNAPDIGSEVSQRYRIKGVPETYFIGKVLRYFRYIVHRFGMFTNLLKNLLGCAILFLGQDIDLRPSG
jgi:hypothetical protein